jgi:hypothetical protein
MRERQQQAARLTEWMTIADRLSDAGNTLLSGARGPGTRHTEASAPANAAGAMVQNRNWINSGSARIGSRATARFAPAALARRGECYEKYLTNLYESGDPVNKNFGAHAISRGRNGGAHRSHGIVAFRPSL